MDGMYSFLQNGNHMCKNSVFIVDFFIAYYYQLWNLIIQKDLFLTDLPSIIHNHYPPSGGEAQLARVQPHETKTHIIQLIKPQFSKAQLEQASHNPNHKCQFKTSERQQDQSQFASTNNQSQNKTKDQDKNYRYYYRQNHKSTDRNNSRYNKVVRQLQQIQQMCRKMEENNKQIERLENIRQQIEIRFKNIVQVDSRINCILESISGPNVMFYLSAAKEMLERGEDRHTVVALLRNAIS